MTVVHPTQIHAYLGLVLQQELTRLGIKLLDFRDPRAEHLPLDLGREIAKKGFELRLTAPQAFVQALKLARLDARVDIARFQQQRCHPLIQRFRVHHAYAAPALWMEW